jgi:hypothetical protein
MLGLCSSCGGPPSVPQPKPCCFVATGGYACKCHELTNATRTYGPVTVTAEAMAEAQRQRVREQNEAALSRWLYFGGIKITCDPTLKSDEIRMIQGGSYGLASGVALDPGPEFQREYLGEWREPKPIDPLDVVVQPGKATLRSLLAADEAMRREGAVAFPFSPEQRAAVSAHWSAQLRAKVAAGAAADEARETSVVVDLEDW